MTKESQELSALEKYALDSILNLDKFVTDYHPIFHRTFWVYYQYPDKVYEAARMVIGQSDSVVEIVADYFLNEADNSSDYKRKPERILYAVSLFDALGFEQEEIAKRVVNSLLTRRSVNPHLDTLMKPFEVYQDGFREAKNEIKKQNPPLYQSLIMSLSSLFTPTYISDTVSEIKNEECYQSFYKIEKYFDNFDNLYIDKTAEHRKNLLSYFIRNNKISAKSFKEQIENEIGLVEQVLFYLQQDLDEREFKRKGYEITQKAINDFKIDINNHYQNICIKLEKLEIEVAKKKKPWYKRVFNQDA